MAAVRNLCTRAMVLENGKTVFEGNTNDAVDFYLQDENKLVNNSGSYKHDNTLNKSQDLILESVELLNSKKKVTSIFLSDEDIYVKVKYSIEKNLQDLRINLKVVSAKNEVDVFTTSSHDVDKTDKSIGYYESQSCFSKEFL